MIAGVLTVVPLRGALSVFSNTVYPTEPAVACPVFAPTSHPLPVLSPAQLPKGAQIIVTTAWDSIRGSSKAIGRLADQQDVTLFLLREHRTGIEGMRAGAMPGFTNVWLDERISWGMQGVHPVSLLIQFWDDCQTFLLTLYEGCRIFRQPSVPTPDTGSLVCCTLATTPNVVSS